jgi:hypothetical protein
LDDAEPFAFLTAAAIVTARNPPARVAKPPPGLGDDPITALLSPLGNSLSHNFRVPPAFEGVNGVIAVFLQEREGINQHLPAKGIITI